MSPSILVVGATGNTGGGVLHHLSSALPSSTQFSKHRIIGLTRSLKGDAAQRLAKLPHVEMVEKDWTAIDATWLRAHEVERLFIASHNGVSHFTDESLFLTYALEAGVKYAVRISTTTANVGPATPVFYGRNHWAVEAMLDTPEFKAMQWTSLQPNVFTQMFIPAVKDWVQQYRKDGTKSQYKSIIDGDHPVAIIDSVEVGIIAGHLLALDDPTEHSGKRYTLVGPEDASGKDIVRLMEKYTGTSIDANYRDLSLMDQLRAMGAYPENVIASLSLAPRSGYEGATSLKGSPTSPEIIALYPPRNGFLTALEAELKSL